MKTFSCTLVRVAALALVAWLAAGCGGVRASHSVSPASILLPGLLQTDPGKAKPATQQPGDAQPTEVAAR